MSNEITLYDLPSKGHCACWSLNPWKARLALNYKGLPYKTEWVEYPDLASTLSGLGIPKNDGTAAATDYSSPAARLPDGSYVMDSLKIAHALEKLQPSPSLHLDSEYVDRALAAVQGVHGKLAPNAISRVPTTLLPERSAEYFERTRAKRFGMPLAEFAKSDKAGETAWKNAEPAIKELSALLAENKEGPYVMGKEVSFADFVMAGYWRFLERLDQGGDLSGRMMGMDPAFAEHRKACAKWLERED